MKHFTATIRDQFGNLVEDGTPVNWTLGFGNGEFVDGGSTTATETTNGQATATLRAPETPGVQHVLIAAGSSETELDIVAEAAGFSFHSSSVTQLDLAVGSVTSGSVTITGANVVDGTPVIWTVSNGAIIGGENGGRIYEGTITNGTATIGITTENEWARLGKSVITATVGGRIKAHEVTFGSSEPIAVEIEHFVLAGDMTSNGVETLVYENPNPTYQGEPVWGFTPPPQQWPATKNVEYYAETVVTVHGAPGERVYVEALEAFDQSAELLDLGGTGDLLLDAVNGLGQFRIRSKGALAGGAAAEFVPVRFRVRNEANTFHRDDQVLFTEHTWSTRSWDAVQSFFGGDPQTAGGILANIAGGVVVVGDVGSVVKNLWRMTPLSDKDPNYVELTLSGLGLATELAVGVGEAADIPISSVRAIVAAIGKTPFTDALVILLKRGLANAQDLTKLGLYLTKILKNPDTFQAVRQIYTSPQAVDASVKAVDDLGDGFLTGLTNFFRENTTIIGEGQFVSQFGASVGRKMTDVFSNLDGPTKSFFQNLPEEQLARAVTDTGYVLARGIDPAQLRAILGFPNLYGTAITQADMLADLQIIATKNAVNFDKLVKFVAESTPGHDTFYGRVYEATALARLLRDGIVTDVEVIQKLVKANADGTGRTLTDIDFIGTVNGQRAYVQTKINMGTAGSSQEAIDRIIDQAKIWIAKARKDASRDGIATPIIRYVVPDKNALPPQVRTYLESVDSDILVDAPFPGF